MAARVDNGRVQLLTRTGLDWTGKYPSNIAALQNLKVKTAYIDGELCGGEARRVMSRSLLVVLSIVVASPVCAESRSGGGFHGACFHRGGFPGRGFAAFHRHGGRVRVFFGGYSYSCGWKCGLG
jgi:hypothetical protein